MKKCIVDLAKIITLHMIIHHDNMSERWHFIFRKLVYMDESKLK